MPSFIARRSQRAARASGRRRPARMPAARCEGAQVAGGLGLLEVAEAERRGRGSAISSGSSPTTWTNTIGWRAALVELAGGVQEARAEAEADVATR